MCPSVVFIVLYPAWGSLSLNHFVAVVDDDVVGGGGGDSDDDDDIVVTILGTIWPSPPPHSFYTLLLGLQLHVY